jgi:hypothetical protein
MAQTLLCQQACDKARRVSQFARSLPFDAAWETYAQAVRLGFIQDSMLAEAKFARDLGKLEKLTLGPLARRV